MVEIILVLIFCWALMGIVFWMLWDVANSLWGGGGKITIKSIIACGPITWIVAPLTYINRKKDRERRALGPKMPPEYISRKVIRQNKNGTLVIDFSNN